MEAGPSPSSEPLALDDVRQRAAGGAALMTVRGGLILIFGLAGNLVLARLLVPRDFGLVSLGNVLLVVGRLLTDGSVVAALVRRPEEPTRRDLEAVQALQLGLSLGLAGLLVAAAVPIGRSGLVPALVALSLPITSLRLPQATMYERELAYRPVAAVDLVEAISYYVWAVAAVAAGLGVWGMASGFIARAIAGTAVMAYLSPWGFVRPRWSWVRVRPLLQFGLRFQAVNVVLLVRDQGLNVGIAVIAGVGTLGLWSFASRILQVPSLLFTSLGRVSYPTMARHLIARADPRELIERTIGIVGVVTGVMMVGLVSAAPALIPLVAGSRWGAVPSAILWAGLGLTVAAPVSVIVVGYLYAAGDAGSVLRATVCETVASFAVAFTLVRTVGVEAAGLGSLAAALVEVTILAGAGQRRSQAQILASLAVPLAVAAPAAALGWTVGSALPRGIAAAVLGPVGGEGVLLLLLVLLRRQLLTDSRRALLGALRASLSH